MTRTAYGMSPEEIRLQDARMKGEEAGRQGLSPEICDYPPGTPEHNEWHRGRLRALVRNLPRRAA